MMLLEVNNHHKLRTEIQEESESQTVVLVSVETAALMNIQTDSTCFSVSLPLSGCHAISDLLV